MKDGDIVEVRETLSGASTTRLDLDEDGVLHLLVGPLTIHLDQPTAEELTNTLATGLLKLMKRKEGDGSHELHLVSRPDDKRTPKNASQAPQ